MGGLLIIAITVILAASVLSQGGTFAGMGAVYIGLVGFCSLVMWVTRRD